ncbi:cellular tumor antigen p53 [Anastrepha ludens]|uniref:cellular tumor antigen p53 n=1 Tax=Anastrepha ludens TaxID=28586 RepID=UPI0023AEE459|nr:cellular tumor antigen p53 [Anastrepha ludens]XP_053947028.1 cellular tumor antigen p53 [Anastrepha ludens]
MIQHQSENSCSSNTVSSPIKISMVQSGSTNERKTELIRSAEENTCVTFQLHPQSKLLSHFVGQTDQQLLFNLSVNQLDTFVSDANSGYEQIGELEYTKPLPLTPENYPNSVIANEYSCSSNQTNKDATMADITHNSDTSNPADEQNPEEDIIPNDEPYAYLQGLNSDNLMQFSQQSAIQELMLKEQLDVKPNLDILPTFEEHDIGGYKFSIQVGSNRKTRMSWLYSSTRKKLYIRMNEIFTLDAVYKPKLPLQQLRVRVLMSFKNEVSEPVLRCQNHISKDTEPHQKRRHSLLRCENPSAEYCGTPEGKNINDRYSILIPLGVSVMPKNDSSIAQTMAIKFTCQNSCIGRKETSLIFLLEGLSGEILSQRVMDVKVCSCPKRDYEADERNSAASSKRKRNEDIPSRTTKALKKKNVYSNHSFVKSEDTSSDLENSDSGISTAQDVALQVTPNGNYRFVVELSDKGLMQKAIELVNQALTLRIYDEPQQAKHYNKMCRKLKRYRDNLQKT